VSIDISTGLGFFASLFIYYLGSGSAIWTASLAAFAILIAMIVSHIWRLDQYLYKTEERYVKNTSILILDVIKLILLLGSCLLRYGPPVPVPL
jgi:hypothetical protein